VRGRGRKKKRGARAGDSLRGDPEGETLKEEFHFGGGQRRKRKEGSHHYFQLGGIRRRQYGGVVGKKI